MPAIAAQRSSLNAPHIGRENESGPENKTANDARVTGRPKRVTRRGAAPAALGYRANVVTRPAECYQAPTERPTMRKPPALTSWSAADNLAPAHFPPI